MLTTLAELLDEAAANDSAELALAGAAAILELAASHSQLRLEVAMEKSRTDMASVVRETYLRLGSTAST